MERTISFPPLARAPLSQSFVFLQLSTLRCFLDRVSNWQATLHIPAGLLRGKGSILFILGNCDRETSQNRYLLNHFAELRHQPFTPLEGNAVVVAVVGRSSSGFISFTLTEENATMILKLQPPGKRSDTALYRRPGGPKVRYGRVRKILPPAGFDPRTVQSVARP